MSQTNMNIKIHLYINVIKLCLMNKLILNLMPNVRDADQ